MVDPAQDYDPPADNLLRTWSIRSDAPENVKRYETLDLRDRQGRDLEPGVYFLRATAPGMGDFYRQNRHFLSVSHGSADGQAGD